MTGCTKPPREFISAVSGGDFDDFDEIGQHLFDLIRGRCNVKPSDHILDIGSGCGRVAIPFTSYLSGGKYDGFDVVLPMVEWCREYITSRYPNFLFNHADLSNTLYRKKTMLETSPRSRNRTKMFYVKLFGPVGGEDKPTLARQCP